MADDPFHAALDALYDFYLANGCPCRFPRFRALGKQWGLPSGMLSSADRDQLVAHFERRVPLDNKRDAPAGWEAECGRCGGTVRWGWVESSPGGSVEYLTLSPGQPDIGAKLEPPALRCRPWRMTGPGYGSVLKTAGRSYTLVEDDEWFAWLRALAGFRAGPTNDQSAR